MAYLYADPIVKKNNLTKELEAADQPLDLNVEYSDIIKNLKDIGKQFTIVRESANVESIQRIISQNPKVIHISCHGDYDKDTQKFYLAIEDINNGVEDKFNEERLK
jgi:basic membrane lipoprotein Med (substrate-binding protein (PBP1-ABC) superfamily)